MIALVDCNNFYVSCEKVFRPDLKKRPMVVLSNNDGCIVAMSKDIKAMGVARGQPYYQVKDILASNRVVVFSGNYALYQSLSNRVMNLLHEHTVEAEVYSIDEAFVRLDGIRDYLSFCTELKRKVEQGTGIPISIGIARTKTLAKVAMEFAKSDEYYTQFKNVSSHCATERNESTNTDAQGLFFLPQRDEDTALSLLPVGELWGIGPKTKSVLEAYKIYTALEFKQAHEDHIRHRYSLGSWRVQQEVRGIESIRMEDAPRSKKGILCSCSFSRPVSDKEELYRSICSYAHTAVNKLQKQNSEAKNISFYIKTSNRSEVFGMRHKSFSKSYSLSLPSAHLPDFLPLIRKGLDEIFQKNTKYSKAGISLSGIERAGSKIDLFNPYDEKKEKLVNLQKTLHRKYGRNSFGVLPAISKRSWDMRRDFLSPHYTTRWSDLPEVKA